MKTQSIPVLIDDCKDLKNFKMTRCSYFSIESVEPSPDWIIPLQNTKIPFYLVGISGILTKPLKGKIFRVPSSIDKLFSYIDNVPSLFVDTNEVWFPNFLFPVKPKRGSVYRINSDLFTLAMRFQSQRISLDEFLSSSWQFKGSLLPSEEETMAFKKWELELIDVAKEKYEKNKNLTLRYVGQELEEKS
jgi:hypothetical protein